MRAHHPGTAVLFAALMGVVRPAFGDDGRAVRLELQDGGPLPFSAAQLEGAVAARLPVARPGADAQTVRISPDLEGGRVVVTSSRRQQDVPLVGKSAPEAARLVALAVVDVLRPEPSEGLAPTSPAATVSDTVIVRDRDRAGLTVALLPGVSVGLDGRALTFEPVLDLALARAGGGGWGLALGYGRAAAAVSGRRFTLDTLPVRLGPRWRWRIVELGGGAVVRLYRTGGLDGGSGAMAGGYASVAASFDLGRGLRGQVTASCDAHAERVVFRAAKASVVTTGPFIAWMGLGLRLGPGR
jgi:hypothetical protein